MPVSGLNGPSGPEEDSELELGAGALTGRDEDGAWRDYV